MTGGELAAARQELGLTQAELGLLVGGVHGVTVCRWERRSAVIPAWIAGVVCALLEGHRRQADHLPRLADALRQAEAVSCLALWGTAGSMPRGAWRTWVKRSALAPLLRAGADHAARRILIRRHRECVEKMFSEAGITDAERRELVQVRAELDRLDEAAPLATLVSQTPEEAVIERLTAGGRIGVATAERTTLSEDERRALADKFGRAPGRALSEIAIDGRGDR